MLRTLLFRNGPREDEFRWRNPEVSRIEGFSDAAFGFAITLLVVSLEVPRTAAELFEALRGFAGFAVTFAMLFSLWKAQFTFFRRYGLEDDTTINLTGLFLFLVMFSVYPLKFLIGMVMQGVLGGGDAFFDNKQDAAWLFFAYGLGFAAIFATLSLMYAHAFRMRDKLELSPLEVFETRFSIQRYALQSLGSVLLLTFPVIFSFSYHTRETVAMPLFFVTGVALAVYSRRFRARARVSRAGLVDAAQAGLDRNGAAGV